jgi:nucleoside-diphosphate kinase
VDVARLLEEMMVATPVERSLVLVKPDGVKRSLTGEIIRRIEAKGIRLVALDLRSLPRELVEEHYAEHEGKPFFEPLVSFMTSGPVVAMIIEGHRCIEAFRTLAGATDPVKAAPGTIRGDLATDIGTTVVQNLVHGSDSPVSAEREIKLFFPELG